MTPENVALPSGIHLPGFGPIKYCKCCSWTTAPLRYNTWAKKHSELKRKHYWGSWGLLNTHTTQCENCCSEAPKHPAATVFDSPATWILWKGKRSLVSPVLPGDPQLFLPTMGHQELCGNIRDNHNNPTVPISPTPSTTVLKQNLREEKPPSHHAFVWEKRCQELVTTRQSLMCLHWSLQHTAHSSINRSKQTVLLYICVAPTVC